MARLSNAQDKNSCEVKFFSDRRCENWKEIAAVTT